MAELKTHLVGKKFNKLTVDSVEIVDSNNKTRTICHCTCECGGKKSAAYCHINTGWIKSCGCLKRLRTAIHKRKAYGESSKNNLIVGYKCKCKKDKISWNLTNQQAEVLFKQDCFYCGIEPRQVVLGKGSYGEYIYNGIDRVDNDKGYEQDNVVSCCKECNYAKKARLVNDFISWACRIAKIHPNGKINEPESK